MLVNPYKTKLSVFGGTRLLLDTLGVVGTEVRDFSNLRRIWTIQSLYAPLPGRAMGGIRARLQDKEGFITFVNQRDLEVLLGLGKPGFICPWSGLRYVGPDDSEWYGLCVDTEDLRDDLQEQELFLRAKHEILPSGIEITRRIHKEERVDLEELLVLLWDLDPETGISPDVRLETIEKRWSRVEQKRVLWGQVF